MYLISFVQNRENINNSICLLYKQNSDFSSGTNVIELDYNAQKNQDGDLDVALTGIRQHLKLTECSQHLAEAIIDNIANRAYPDDATKIQEIKIKGQELHQQNKTDKPKIYFVREFYSKEEKENNTQFALPKFKITQTTATKFGLKNEDIEKYLTENNLSL